MLYKFYNTDCIEGCKKYVSDNSVDLVITDPPYGINGDQLHKHYNRNENNVLEGYVEIPKIDYPEFSYKWITQTERILRPGGSAYIVSGYTNLIHILNALKQTKLKEINHIIWKYNFGVFTKNKYVSSHYHILYYVKLGRKPTFNTYVRYGALEKDKNGNSLNYKDREDVWIINREYKPGKIKNKNELPTELLKKIILYSSNEGDIICDLFLGSFSTAKVAKGLNRNVIGFEINKTGFDYQTKVINNLSPGYLFKELRLPLRHEYSNLGKSWSNIELNKLYERYDELYSTTSKKNNTIKHLCKEFGRGYFSILNKIKSRADFQK